MWETAEEDYAFANLDPTEIIIKSASARRFYCRFKGSVLTRLLPRSSAAARAVRRVPSGRR